MQDRDDRATAIEAAKVLDTLAALSLELKCYDQTPDTLVMNARRVKEVCDAIDDSVQALKRILTLNDGDGTSILVRGGSPPDE